MNRNVMKYSLSFILLFIIGKVLTAQNFTVTGTVINAETGAAVEFANIGIEGTYLGTASDMDGNFEIKLSEALLEKQISISAVGYKSKVYQVREWSKKDGLMIQLAPVNYGISEINVAAKSKIGYGIIRTAAHLITDNYIVQPYTYRCYMRTVTNMNGKSFMDEAIVLLTDSKGYGERSFAEAYQNIHYRIVQNNPHRKVALLKEGLTFMDDLISWDIVRNPGNILSVESMNDFEVNVEGETALDGDSVWVLSYDCQKPDVQNAGDPQLTTYKGKIWVTQENNKVLKNSFEATRIGASRHGNSFYVSKENATPLKYKVETHYKRKDGKLALNSVQYLQEESNGQETAVYLKVVEVEAYDNRITGRQYYNGDDKNEGFWNKYKRPE
ncbi:carboxypeptidase-like regulatory domain-containing protein [Saccharicrinis fermentans]|uniref:TonB-linked outer membrane protein, SusC/RagA family n=1 Tax=Saccharicrinis fermentans DSM 9555 = JCM 21142 TaxID=869213 RepID=W7YGE0_9BACT|nr:carboxypeptidase-like regulatory domain-containing protein [Saccharicrinis fermentans]GAF03491.1 TonB-linked outer membrane protein, SusC/RagA family [Saccharicrinis fermentans DSM 9555 = JCM 21142]